MDGNGENRNKNKENMKENDKLLCLSCIWERAFMCLPGLMVCRLGFRGPYASISHYFALIHGWISNSGVKINALPMVGSVVAVLMGPLCKDEGKGTTLNEKQSFFIIIVCNDIVIKKMNYYF